MISDEARLAGHAAQRRKGDAVRRRIAGAIMDYWTVHEIPPTVRDLQDLCSLSSPSVVAHHLTIMEQEGTITRDPRVSRSIRLVSR